MTTDRKCFASHLGFWLFEPFRFQQAAAAVLSGSHPILEARAPKKESRLFELLAGGVARIPVEGVLMKGFGKFNDTSTVAVRQALRQARDDQDVEAILLHIDSPGGHAAGTQELADDVRATDAVKPVFAHIDDLGASAAFWVASQAREVTANRSAEIGSIGTVAVVDDHSERFEKAGIKTHVISTGPHKGAFVQGAPVEEHHLEDLQQRVDDLNEQFLQAVTAGRGLAGERLEAVSDGRVHIAAKALSMGLIDGIASLDTTVARIRETIAEPRRRATRARFQQGHRRRAGGLKEP